MHNANTSVHDGACLVRCKGGRVPVCRMHHALSAHRRTKAGKHKLEPTFAVHGAGRRDAAVPDPADRLLEETLFAEALGYTLIKYI